MKNMKPLLLIMLLFCCVYLGSTEMQAQDTIYLPIIVDSPSISNDTSGHFWPDGSKQADGIPPIDIFNLPPCTDKYLEQKAYENAPMDLNSTEGCRAQSTRYELDQVSDVIGVGIGDDVKASEIFMTRKYSLNQFYCPGCSTITGLTGVYAMLSPQQPTLGSGTSWTSKWYGNYVTIGTDKTITCQNSTTTLTRAIAGVGIGKLTDGATLTTPTVFYELIRHGSCNGYATSITPSATTALYPYINIYKDANGSTSTYWTGRVYTSGAWQYLFTHEEFDFYYAGHLLNVGQEIGSYANDHNSMTVPLNFAHKIAIRPYGLGYYPWYNNFLPSAIQGKSTVVSNTPLNSQGIIVNGPDFTSRASTSP